LEVSDDSEDSSSDNNLLKKENLQQKRYGISTPVPAEKRKRRAAVQEKKETMNDNPYQLITRLVEQGEERRVGAGLIKP